VIGSFNYTYAPGLFPSNINNFNLKTFVQININKKFSGSKKAKLFGSNKVIQCSSRCLSIFTNKNLLNGQNLYIKASHVVN